MAETPAQRAERMAERAARREENRQRHLAAVAEAERVRVEAARVAAMAVYGVPGADAWMRSQERMDAVVRLSCPALTCSACGAVVSSLCLPVLWGRMHETGLCPGCATGG